MGWWFSVKIMKGRNARFFRFLGILGRMIRIFLLIFGAGVIGFCAGIWPWLDDGRAQADVFVRYKGGDAGGESEAGGKAAGKRSIYLRRYEAPEDGGRSAPRAVAQRPDFSRVLDAQRQQNKLKNDLAALAYWEQSGRQPKGIEEIRSYADARRAPGRAAMLERRAKKMAYFDALKRKQLVDYNAKILAEAPNPEAVLAYSALQLSQEQARFDAKNPNPAGVLKARSITRGGAKPRTRIYRRKDSGGVSKPSRVIRDYR